MTTFGRLAAAGEVTPLLVQLMMVVNDLSLADDGLRSWSGNQPNERQHRAPGARSYYVRLQVAHTFEALKVIGKIDRTPSLKALVQGCDRQTRDAFARLVAFIGTDKYKSMKRLRDAITFHYLTDAIEAAIERQANKFPDYPLTLSIGSKTLDWYFEPGDRITDSIIVRDALGLDTDPVDPADVDKVAVLLQKIAEDLANFAGYFIPRYCARR